MVRGVVERERKIRGIVGRRWAHRRKTGTGGKFRKKEKIELSENGNGIKTEMEERRRIERREWAELDLYRGSDLFSFLFSFGCP